MNQLPEQAERAHAQAPRTGVLLINLGTPDAPTPSAIRRYLAEFLRDRRVVDLPRPLWLPILYSFILPLRPRRLAHAYASIWEDDGAPLLVIGRRQADGLAAALTERFGESIPVALGMRYGNPSIERALSELEQAGARRILTLPLYPQYSASTTASSFDAVFAALSRRRWMPELRTVGAYHDHPGYIAALADRLRRHWNENGPGEHLLMSFHGVPQRYVLSGDPYYCQCRKTARLLAEALQLPAERWSVSFQSRFGREPWLQPYTDVRIVELARGGVRALDVVCPGFAADCLETLEEVAQRYRDDFLTAGGRRFEYVPALNDDAAHLQGLADLLQPHLQGWLPQISDAQQIAARRETAMQHLGDFTVQAPSS